MDPDPAEGVVEGAYLAHSSPSTFVLHRDNHHKLSRHGVSGAVTARVTRSAAGRSVVNIVRVALSNVQTVGASAPGSSTGTE